MVISALKDAEWASPPTETYFRVPEPRKPPVTESLDLRSAPPPREVEHSVSAASLPTLEGAVAATAGGVPSCCRDILEERETQVKGHVDGGLRPRTRKFSREYYFRPFGSLSSTMAVGKNKRLTKGGKKGAKKKV